MKIVSVVFKPNSKEYYFKCDSKLYLKKNDKVVVDTVRGLELAFVEKYEVKHSNVAIDSLALLVRKANKKDLENYEKNKELNKKGFEDFNKILLNHPELEMNLVSCEYNLDQTRILFMYVADDRVDFRALLKDLASHFHKRIELKQIGARDKAKLVGGIGPCGMETCCKKYIKDFDNISINMAKNQMLSLNPGKISGLCGRLLCCLKFENEAYSKEKEHFPRLGSNVSYNNQNYKVTSLNIISDEIRIENQDNMFMVTRKDIKW
ncbi:MAG: stage 0 sporulation protein [Bacilli bacterium]|jgi:cell fate regulator YaaT (PSP1 superfamily)|nr:stage 0 sporulation protein [Bacilli bacterium]